MQPAYTTTMMTHYTTKISFIKGQYMVVVDCWYDGERYMIDSAWWDTREEAEEWALGRIAHDKRGVAKEGLWEEEEASREEEEDGLRCPACNEVVWDVAFGYKLNKCWNCMLAFDGPWEEDDELS